MRKIQILLAALVAVMMCSCVNYKTEATVDVKVTKNGQPQANIEVYKAVAHGDVGGGFYRTNYQGSPVRTDASGIAHFDLKSPDDFAPSSVGAQDEIIVHFAVFNGDDCRGYKAVSVKTGDKKEIELPLDEE